MAQEPAMKTMVLCVAGMTCQHCASGVERAISAVPGVVEARVDLLAGQVRVQLEEGRLADVIEAVRRAGYEVQRYEEAV